MTARYTVTYAPRAVRDLRKLPEKIATAVEFIRVALAENPHRVGKPLTSSWEGYYSARRSEWRIIYHIDDHRVLIEVVTIAHRADSYGHADSHGGDEKPKSVRPRP